MTTAAAEAEEKVTPLYAKPVQPVIATPHYDDDAAKPRALVDWCLSDADNDELVKIECTHTDVKSVRPFVERATAHLPRYIQRYLVNEYARRYTQQTRKDGRPINNPARNANIYLRKAVEHSRDVIARLPFYDLDCLHLDDKRDSEAQLHADTLLEHVRTTGEQGGEYLDNLQAVTDYALAYCERLHVKPPLQLESELDAALETGVLKREIGLLKVTCPKWWQRRFKVLAEQVNEQLFISNGFVRKGRMAYCSHQAVGRYRAAKASAEHYLASMDVVNEDTGERVALADIAAQSSTDPEKRRTELMVRMRGLEGLADDMDYQSFFVTLTAPSRYHPSGREYNHATPKQTNAYLLKQWAKVRAEVARRKIEWFGVRVAEPHASGTPHWHMLVFCGEHDAPAMKAIIQHYALEHDGDEKGAEDNRVIIEDIDRAKGSATGYIAKYIAKNINANHCSSDDDYETDGKSSLGDAVERVAAWARTWRIRQFQFFGAAPVTLWRECRRLKESSQNPAIEAVRAAADSGNWQLFTAALQDNAVKVAYEEADKPNQYGEILRRPNGIQSLNFIELSRKVRYTLQRRNAAQSGDSRATWSTVTNCTNHDNDLKQFLKQAGFDPAAAAILKKGGRVYDSGRGIRLQNGAIIPIYQPKKGQLHHAIN